MKTRLHFTSTSEASLFGAGLSHMIFVFFCLQLFACCCQAHHSIHCSIMNINNFFWKYFFGVSGYKGDRGSWSWGYKQNISVGFNNFCWCWMHIFGKFFKSCYISNYSNLSSPQFVISHKQKKNSITRPISGWVAGSSHNNLGYGHLERDRYN